MREGMPLYGREPEMDAFDALLEGLESHGAAVIVRGEAGIGKSALLDAVALRGQLRGMAVLRATGVPSEADLPFAGLHQLLHARMADLGRLPVPQRIALESAFGMTE